VSRSPSHWSTRNGATIVGSTATTFRLDLVPDSGTLVRIDDGIETAFTLTAEFQAPRDFPTVVADDAGGALAMGWVERPEGGGMIIAHFAAETSESPARAIVYGIGVTQIELLEPTYTVLVIDGDHFTRKRIADIALQP